MAALSDYDSRYQSGARRFDVGERSNLVMMPMIIRALEQIDGWGVENISATLARLSGYLAECAVEAGLAVSAAGHNAPHLTGLRLPRQDPRAVLEALNAAGVHISLRGDCVRVSPHLYNDKEDIDRLIAVLRRQRPHV